MKTTSTYLFVIALICGFGSFFLSCGNWEIPTKKTQRQCVKPSGTPNTQIKNRKVDFSITNATGTIDKVVWDFGGSGPTNTTITTGLTASYTYPASTTFSAKATLSNLCGDETTVVFAGLAADPILPVVNVQSATTINITTATVGFVVVNPGTPNAVEYGIIYSTSATPDATNSTTVTVANPTVGTSTTVNLTNLTSGTKYYYRTYVKLPSGEIVLGPTVESFTTPIDTLVQDLIASVAFTDRSLLDVSGYNNHVKPVGNPTFTTDHMGRPNSAILLNGTSDYFYMPDNSSLNPEALSISLWIKPVANLPIGVDGRMQIYNKSRFSDGKYQMYSSLVKLENDVGPDLTFMTDLKQNSNCQGGVGWQSFPFTKPVELNKWYHLVFTYSGRSVRMYFNNLLVAKGDNLIGDKIDYCPGGELKFGAQDQLLPWYFNGAMDDIRIYKRAITPAEVQTLFNQ